MESRYVFLDCMVYICYKTGGQDLIRKLRSGLSKEAKRKTSVRESNVLCVNVAENEPM